ncbi:MAG: nuclear transport factor 2 family protein [Lewinellaceae bacterium]|nr:nuclear transport factor 2 family protein [Saprospiraceae bacterium]MCB9330524.1 nuclear transport factor 2 family protein [Lewinellaceae bacterium]
MTFKNTTLLFMLAAAGILPLTAQTTDSDSKAVERTLLNYVEGFYEGDTTKLIAAFLPEMNKFGYWKDDKSGAYSGSAMTYREALDFAIRVQEKKRFAKPDAPKVVEVFEVQDQTASGKVTAYWGTDYILLGKYDGVWKIVHVLWQGPLKS